MDDGETFDAEDAENWINLNSFMAWLMERNLVHWTNFAIWNFRAALEEPPQPQAVMDCHASVLDRPCGILAKVLSRSGL